MNSSRGIFDARPSFAAAQSFVLAAMLSVLSACDSNSSSNKNNANNSSAENSSSSQSVSSVTQNSSNSAVVSSSAQAQSSSADNSGALSGVAATGAPIAGANITAKCTDGSGFMSTVTTGDDGSFSGEVGIGLWPCALQLTVTGSERAIHSVAYQSGTVNISPLTDMALAYTYSAMPAQWFAGDIASIAQDAFNQGMTSFLDALEQANYLIPDNFDPITSAFTIGDSADALIADLVAGFAADQSLGGYDDWLTLLKDGNLAALPPSTTYNPNNKIEFTLDGKSYSFPLEAGFGVLGVSFSVVEQEAGSDGIWTQVYVYLNDYRGPGTYPFNTTDFVIVDNQVENGDPALVRCRYTGENGASGQYVITQSNGILHGSFEATVQCAEADGFGDEFVFTGSYALSGTFQYEYAGD